MLTIGQVAAKAGIRPSAIRYYEERGLLPRAARVANARVYDDSIFSQLACIALAKSAGFSLKDIRDVLAGAPHDKPSARWRRPASAKREALDAEMARLRLMQYILSRMARCSCTTLEQCGQMFNVALARYRSAGG